jgi:hypothetical protein
LGRGEGGGAGDEGGNDGRLHGCCWGCIVRRGNLMVNHYLTGIDSYVDLRRSKIWRGRFRRFGFNAESDPKCRGLPRILPATSRANANQANQSYTLLHADMAT